MDYEEFKKKYANIHKASFDEGRAEGFKAGLGLGRKSSTAHEGQCSLSQQEGSKKMSQIKKFPEQFAHESLNDFIDRKWKADPALRSEFNNDFLAFSAYMKAEAKSQIRVLGRSNSGKG